MILGTQGCPLHLLGQLTEDRGDAESAREAVCAVIIEHLRSGGKGQWAREIFVNWSLL